jgi:hypothetical protein
LNAYRKQRRESDAQVKAQQDAWWAEYHQTQHYKDRRAADHKRKQSGDPIYRDKRQEGYHRRKQTLWQQVLDAYGRKCSCPTCSETIEEFLTIDHTDGYLSGPRSGEKLWRWLRDNGFPQDGFRLLCYNCNCGRERNNGVCPHEDNLFTDTPVVVAS